MKCTREDCPCPTPASWKEYKCRKSERECIKALWGDTRQDDRAIDYEWLDLLDDDTYYSPYNDG